MGKQKVDLKQPLAFFPAKTVSVAPSSGDPKAWQGDLLVWGVYEDFGSGAAAELDKEYGGLIEEMVTAAEFKGRQGESEVMRLGQPGKPRFVGLVGLGKPPKGSPTPPGWGPSASQVLGAAVATQAKACRCRTAAVAVVESGSQQEPLSAEKLAAGVHLAVYEATRFKADPKTSPLEGVELFLPGGGGGEEGIRRGTAMARGYLVEAPANLCTPAYLAQAAAAIAEAAPDVMALEVLEEAECEAMNMGLYLGVTECSELPAKFIHLTYKPPGEVKRRVALVGKGLTFDSGGYNLKVGGMIEMMKFDMGGAAAVLGAAQALAGLKPPGVEVHIISAACENMVSGKGLHPGDVLQAANGKTVEVNNTDAEGRLTLADALWYAQHKCGAVDAIVDIATLTGSMMVALGTGMAGVFPASDAIAESLLEASRASGEKLWRMPMEDTYWEQMKSPIADMKNAGTRYGGSITAALFLKQYVDTEKVEWAHIDIAGPAWDEKKGGATGYGALTLAEWAVKQGQ